MPEHEDLQESLVAAESDADESFSTQRVGDPVLPCGRLAHWIEVRLLDEGAPASGVQYKLTLPDGQEVSGALNSRGRLRVEGIHHAGECTIVFPDIDRDEGPNAGPSEAESDANRGQARSSEAAEIEYVPGRVPEAIATDARYVYTLPGWELLEVELSPREGEPANESASSSPVPGPDDGDDEDDWDLVSIELARDG